MIGLTGRIHAAVLKRRLAERPEGGALFAKLNKGDVVIAPKLDRLFRSALDALTVVSPVKPRAYAWSASERE